MIALRRGRYGEADEADWFVDRCFLDEVERMRHYSLGSIVIAYIGYAARYIGEIGIPYFEGEGIAFEVFSRESFGEFIDYGTECLDDFVFG